MLLPALKVYRTSSHLWQAGHMIVGGFTGAQSVHLRHHRGRHPWRHPTHLPQAASRACWGGCWARTQAALLACWAELLAWWSAC